MSPYGDQDEMFYWILPRFQLRRILRPMYFERLEWTWGRYLVALIVFVVVAKVIYNIYLHPLAKYPGPKLCAVSSIPVASAQLKGKLHNFTKKLHDRYGDVVRISPSELSFISAAAWNDIYARRNGKPALARDKTFFNDMLVGQDTMTMADDAKHARLRRAMNPAFAPRALAAQEAIIQKSITLFLNRVHDLSVQGSLVDLRLWYNYVTFDVIGDLAFGDSFGCLENSKYHDWVTFVLDYFYASTLLQVVHRFRPLNRLFAAMIPASLADKRKKHEEMALEKVRRRIKRGAERPDFTHPLIEAEKDGTISTSELEHQASILILAGSETTSVALTSATHLLLENPKALAKLVKELRNSFRSESEVDVLSIHKLHYLQAVIQETLRLYPPITNGFPRQPYDENAVVDGHLIPYGTTVNISHWSAYRSEKNFAKPNEFIPERWLGDERFKNDNRDVYQPFSVGPRNCIGKKFAYDSMKLVLGRTFLKFEMGLYPGSRQKFLANPISYVSFHQPPLLVKLATRCT